MKSIIHQIVSSKLCIGCGLCSIESSTQGIKFSKKNDCFIPMQPNIFQTSAANQICPGKGYKIVELGKELYANEAFYDTDLGFYRSFSAARSNAEDILKNASSGGVITSMLLYLLENNIVDKVSVTQFSCSEKGVFTKTFLTSDNNEIRKAQGSKYCPVNVANLLDELHKCKEHERVSIVGTPCVIAGIRNIQKECPEYIQATIVLTISNFCGGFKSFSNVSRLAEIHKINYRMLKDFRFRGGGQPGSLRFVTLDEKVVSTPYPKYVGLTGQSKMLRCHLCVDATGELADIACGDAWIPRFQRDSHPWSVVICRSKYSTSIIDSMEADKKLILANMSVTEIKESQRLNLTSKKRRQKARMKLYKLFGYQIPIFDGGYYLQKTSLIIEFQVFIKHQMKQIAENMGLYLFLYSRKKAKK